MSPSNMRNGLGETRLTRLTGIQSLVNPVRLPESSQLHSHARAGFQESLGYKTAWTQTLKPSKQAHLAFFIQPKHLDVASHLVR